MVVTLGQQYNTGEEPIVIFQVGNKYAECEKLTLLIAMRRLGSSEVPRNPLTRWDVSSIPANGIFLTKKLKNEIKMPNRWRTIKSLVHKIRLHDRRGTRMAESFWRVAFGKPSIR